MITTNKKKKTKNPTTIEEMIALRNEVKATKELKSRISKEYSKKLKIEQQGGIYEPPQDLKDVKKLKPKKLLAVNFDLVLDDVTNNKDVTDQVFVGED